MPKSMILPLFKPVNSAPQINQKKIKKTSNQHSKSTMSATNDLVPASPASPAPSTSESALSVPTELTLVAERRLRRPDRLELLCKKHLKALDGPRRLDLIVELAERTQDGERWQLTQPL